MKKYIIQYIFFNSALTLPSHTLIHVAVPHGTNKFTTDKGLGLPMSDKGLGLLTKTKMAGEQ